MSGGRISAVVRAPIYLFHRDFRTKYISARIRARRLYGPINCYRYRGYFAERDVRFAAFACYLMLFRGNYALPAALSKSARSSAHWRYLRASLSGAALRRCLRNYLSLLIADPRRPSVVVNPYFPRLNGENKQRSGPRPNILSGERLNVSRASCAVCGMSNRDVPSFALYTPQLYLRSSAQFRARQQQSPRNVVRETTRRSDATMT